MAFLDNTTGTPASGIGGAIGLEWTDPVRIADCQFRGNSAYSRGGAVYLNCIPGTARIEGCRFEINSSSVYYAAAAIWADETSFTIDGCEFLSEVASEAIESVFSSASEVHIVDSRFEDRGHRQATRLYLSNQTQFGPYLFEIRGNVFWCASPPAGGEASLGMDLAQGTVSVLGNTFQGTPVECLGGGSLQIDFERNICCQGTCHLVTSLTGQARCNDFWPDDPDVSGGIVLTDNIQADPLFCDESQGDLSLSTDSPCAPEHSPAGCGRIGALDVQCGGTPVERSTWGRIKARFHERG